MTTSARIIADTVNPNWPEARITTFEVHAPRYLLAEVNTHRVIAKSAASSRAIPVAKRIKMVREAPYVPEVFGKNKPGMQSDEQLSVEANEKAKAAWLRASQNACMAASELNELQTHKQQANRILEPYVYYDGVMTATEWDNFFNLRAHPDADPEFQKLAAMMKKLYEENTPVEVAAHLPYVHSFDAAVLNDAYGPWAPWKVSAARCARVSYKTFDGRVSGVEEDIELCEKLITSGHLSPFDHQAFADSYLWSSSARHWRQPVNHRHFWGWVPYRVEVERSLGLTCYRDSHDGF